MKKTLQYMLMLCTVLFTSSVAAVTPIPYQAFYSACKAAINSVVMALRNELRGTGIRVAAVLPGGGQIYNRKFWKLPIFYGGFVGCIYALSWNNQMYHDYSQAYIDIMDNDPSTQSYNSFLHLGTTITEANKKQYQEVFRKRKDRFRRYRDLSVFVLIGVYALSIVDAYVDASLSEFDISDNLSLHIQPAVFGNQAQGRPQQPAGVGIGIGLTF